MGLAAEGGPGGAGGIGGAEGALTLGALFLGTFILEALPLGAVAGLEPKTDAALPILLIG